jgi:hypothetical protein
MGFLLLAGALVALSVWFIPVLGLVAAAIFVACLAPIGRRFTERASMSLVLVLAVLALTTILPLGLTLTWTSVRVGVTALVAAVIGARVLIRSPQVPLLPERRWTDAVGLGAGVLVGMMIILPFAGASSGAALSGLLTSWDLWAHFSFFANTYQAGSSIWTTADPSGPYGSGYPQLPFVLWTDLQWLVQGSPEPMAREDLIFPYVTWIGVTVGTCATLLTWLAGDIAERLGMESSKSYARALAVTVTGIVMVFGSFSTYANAGHANFALGVTIIAVASYWSMCCRGSTLQYGWLIVPAAALCCIALWPPLVLGVAATGLGIVVVLWTWRRSASVAYALVAAIVVVGAGWKYLSILLSPASVDSLSSGGASGGLASYSIPMALVGPAVLLAGAILAWRRLGWQMGVALGSATLGLVPFVLYLMASVDAAGTPRLDSYFLLKIAGGLVLAATAALVAFAAVVGGAGLEQIVGRLGQPTWVWSTGLVAAGAVTLAGTYGLLNAPSIPSGFPQAPGFAAYQLRQQLVDGDRQGPLIIEAARLAASEGQRTPLFWDNNGVLMTSWLQALLGVRTNQDVAVAEAIGVPPSGEPPVANFNRLLRENPRLNVHLFWTNPGLFEPLRPTAEQFGDVRVKVTELN